MTCEYPINRFTSPNSIYKSLIHVTVRFLFLLSNTFSLRDVAFLLTHAVSLNFLCGQKFKIGKNSMNNILEQFKVRCVHSPPPPCFSKQHRGMLQVTFCSLSLNPPLLLYYLLCVSRCLFRLRLRLNDK
jgi:hypothetical protein